MKPIELRILKPSLVASSIASSLIVALSLNASTISEYTQSTSSPSQVALGYPVPEPQESLLPFDGYRTYDSLHARHQSLVVQSDLIKGNVIGQTINGESIWAYTLSTESHTQTDGHSLKPAFLQNGGIHAREWQTPEVVTGIMERFYDNQDDQHVYQYLMENTKLILIPVLNIDGFKQTQKYYNQFMPSTDPNDPSYWPRDGRMRRKNLREADTELSTFNNNLLGVDLNRNNAPFWNTTTRSSSLNTSIVHHGASAGSEPEIQALQYAASLGPESQLRFYVDTHSYSQIYFTSPTGNTRRDEITTNLASKMRATNNYKYEYGPSSPGAGIGTTDEYFAYTYQIPSYTLEVEPGPDGAVQYGGNGVSHDGFILPESEIARVRDELATEMTTAYYHQSGPAFLQKVQIYNGSETLVFDGHWNAVSTTSREWIENVNIGLTAGENFSLRLVFNKPMRAVYNQQVTQHPGQEVNLAATVRWQIKDSSGSITSQNISVNQSDWQYNIDGDKASERYHFDTLVIDFTASTAMDDPRILNLYVDTADMVGMNLDADPSSIVNWSNGHWTSYENETGTSGDIGGSDQQVYLINDGSGLETPNKSDGSGGGSMGLLMLIVLAAFRHKTPFNSKAV